MTTTSMAAAAEVDVPPHGRPRRRLLQLLQLLIAAVAVLGAVGLTAGPASAAQTCTARTDSNLCLAINGVGSDRFDVLVGIDVHMSAAAAQEYIDDPGNPFVVEIFGGHAGGPLFTVPLTNLGATDEFGLSGDFEMVVPGWWLNENSSGQDSIRAHVALIDSDTGTTTATFVSNAIVGFWS